MQASDWAYFVNDCLAIRKVFHVFDGGRSIRADHSIHFFMCFALDVRIGNKSEDKGLNE